MKLRMALGAFIIIATACSSKSPSMGAPQGLSPMPTADLVTCLQDTDSRTLEIKKGPASGCELVYTKFGTSKSVASSSSSDKHCREVRDKIFANLTRSGFKCE